MKRRELLNGLSLVAGAALGLVPEWSKPAIGQDQEHQKAQSFALPIREPVRRWRESARPCALVRSRVQVQRQEAGSAADSNAVEAEAYLSSGPSADTDTSLVLLQLPVVTPKSPRVLVRLPGRVHNRACAGAAHQQRFGPPGKQQLSGCRSDRWQLSRNGSRFCGYRAPVACVYLIRGGARPGCVAFSFPCSGIPEKK